ncbi:hypothetical protein PI125_g13875 [Phytophthora idaei]|nr:hypothetical protein PI125_g13875 [Phytophthora idaei]KAG3137515.1 hypothetical protein PI126_g17368 [Phytophthora idaei]
MTPDEHVAFARTQIARLLQRLNQMEAFHASVKQPQYKKPALQTDLSASRNACDDLADQVGRLTTEEAGQRTERNQARD